MIDKRTILHVLRTLYAEIDRFREGSEDPSSEPVTIDMLQTVIERTVAVYE